MHATGHACTYRVASASLGCLLQGTHQLTLLLDSCLSISHRLEGLFAGHGY